MCNLYVRRRVCMHAVVSDGRGRGHRAVAVGVLHGGAGEARCMHAWWEAWHPYEHMQLLCQVSVAGVPLQMAVGEPAAELAGEHWEPARRGRPVSVCMVHTCACDCEGETG